MFKKILMPIDGSELSEIPLPWGEELAGRLGADVELLHVRGHERIQDYDHVHRVYLDRLADNMRHHISDTYPKFSNVKVTTRVEIGEPQESICRIVDEDKADLIIMTAVSAAGLKIGKMLGSVADHVCRTVPIPVLLVRPKNAEEMAGKKQLVNHILVTLDGSELSKLALPVAEDLALKLQTEITLFQMARMIRVFNETSDLSAPSSYIDYTKIDNQEKERVKNQMIDLDIEARKKGLDADYMVTLGFDAAEDILEACKKSGADLMVMSTHGRTGLGRFAFGSVAEKMLRHGEIPLLLVNARAS